MNISGAWSLVFVCAFGAWGLACYLWGCRSAMLRMKAELRSTRMDDPRSQLAREVLTQLLALPGERSPKARDLIGLTRHYLELRGFSGAGK